MYRLSNEPWKLFVPDLNTRAIEPPAECPYSSDIPVAETDTSWIASAFGRRMASVSPKLLIPAVFVFIPSSV
jgi:hypothetical protein